MERTDQPTPPPTPAPASYDPLSTPDTEVAPAPLERELQAAREYLAQVAAANIHDHQAMVKAAACLHYRLQSLIAAVNAEQGERR
ncbi:hypothetical protein ACFYQA_08375 [Streptomyces sp. NPDC005774]|uniref:hypothetical protein n=1 Tax=Streptomyces sp. NPDC005774 TaxID=3364728 RepID=UPI0036C5CBC5